MIAGIVIFVFDSLYVWLVIARDNGYHKLAYRRILRNCLVSQNVDTMLDRCTIEMALGASQRFPWDTDEFPQRDDMSNRANLNKSSPATRAYQEPTPGPRQPHRKGVQKTG
uniref:Uncharacterized protein n=1 Tax=Glossina austeni TaxID=7395 RepID=A0A1A9V1E4_GLOAU